MMTGTMPKAGGRVRKIGTTCLFWLTSLAVATGLLGCQKPAAPKRVFPAWPRINLAVGYKVDPNWPADPPPAP